MDFLKVPGGGHSPGHWSSRRVPAGNAEGGANLTVHPTYLNRYQNAAASFVLGKIGG